MIGHFVWHLYAIVVRYQRFRHPTIMSSSLGRKTTCTKFQSYISKTEIILFIYIFCVYIILVQTERGTWLNRLSSSRTGVSFLGVTKFMANIIYSVHGIKVVSIHTHSYVSTHRYKQRSTWTAFDFQLKIMIWFWNDDYNTILLIRKSILQCQLATNTTQKDTHIHLHKNNCKAFALKLFTFSAIQRISEINAWVEELSWKSRLLSI